MDPIFIAIILISIAAGVVYLTTRGDAEERVYSPITSHEGVIIQNPDWQTYIECVYAVHAGAKNPKANENGQALRAEVEGRSPLWRQHEHIRNWYIGYGESFPQCVLSNT